MARKELPRIIAQRRRCRATGTGLSHYILVRKEPAK